MKVRVLPDGVVDRIAAGEVVERPAAVVKELVENALDAGAQRVEVRLQGGGADLVRVLDDGTGMDAEDAVLCLERHATSKIRDFDDLEGVSTLGFRGEALPSIASVSRFELHTRRAEDEVGTEVRIDGGRIEHVGPVVMPPGTDIAVRALFAQVPARRKFLRSPSTELAHATNAVIRAFLVRPDVAVKLQHEGRVVLAAEVTQDPAQRIRDLLGSDLRNLARGEAEAEGVRAVAWVAPAGVERSSPGEAVWTFVGGRYVRDAILRKSVAEGLGLRAVAGHHAVVVVFVDVPAGEVDVNVHPAKIEVRFRAPHLVGRVVREAVASSSGRPAEQDASERRPWALELPVSAPRPPAAPAPLASAMPPEALIQAWRPSPMEMPVVPAPARAAGACDEAPSVAAPSPQVRAPAPTLPRPVRWVWRAGAHGLIRDGEGGVWGVDLSAAHRTAVMASLAERRAAGEDLAGWLLSPVIVPMDAVRRERVLAAAETLATWGVGVSDIGAREVALTSLPDGILAEDVERLLSALVQGGSPEQGLARFVASTPRDDAEADVWLVDAADHLDPFVRRLDEAIVSRWVRGG